MPLVDTLLRCAEHPALYLPRWTDEIIAESSRTLIGKLRRSQVQADYRETMLREFFANAWITGYEALIDTMPNHPKDRHVLAAAAASKADCLVTFNLRDFPVAFGNISVIGPSAFLRQLRAQNLTLFDAKLREQAADIDLTFEELLGRLERLVPSFVQSLR